MCEDQLSSRSSSDEEFIHVGNRKDFSREEKYHLLHMWKINDEDDLFSNTLSMLNGRCV